MAFEASVCSLLVYKRFLLAVKFWGELGRSTCALTERKGYTLVVIDINSEDKLLTEG